VQVSPFCPSPQDPKTYIFFWRLPGVIGLSTAIKLQEAGYKVDICARDLPGDRKTINAASAWAVS